jgi:hypothetical protein
VAVAASALIVVAVAAVVLAARAGHHPSRHLHPVGHGAPTVLRNVYPTALPARPGQLVFALRLTRPSGGKAPAGEVRFYVASPTLNRMVLTAAGLRKLAARDVYAAWLLPAHKFTSSPTESAGLQVAPGVPPQLLGLIEPPVGSSGRLTVVSLLHDASVGGTYRLEIAVQPRSSITEPGSVVLQGFVNF